MLRIHPDIVTSYGPDVVAVNEASLQELFTLLDAIKIRATNRDARDSTPPPRIVPLQPRYSFSFYYRGVGGGGESDLRRTTHVVNVPPLFEQRVAVLDGRGQGDAARAHCLLLAVDALRKLLTGVGLTGEAQRLALAPELAALIEREDGGRRRRSNGGGLFDGDDGGGGGGDGEPAGGSGARQRERHRPGSGGAGGDTAYAALRDNLRNMSPLEQGKGDGGFDRTSTASVFPAKVRRERALAVLASPDRVAPVAGVPAEHARDALSRLLAVMTAHHDALRLYDPLWPAMSVTLEEAGGPWASHPSTGTLHVPVDFSAGEFVEFVDRAWPQLMAAGKERRREGRQKAAAAAAARRRPAGQL